MFQKVTSCVGVGHGQKIGADADQAYSPNLRRTRILPLKSHQECEDALNANYFLPNHSITWTAHPSHLCAGGEEDSDTCEGDGGGPLVCREIPEEIEGPVASEGGINYDYDEGDEVFGDDSDSSYTYDEGDEVFGDIEVIEDLPIENSSNEIDPCDDTDDILGLRTSTLCKKRDGDSPVKSGAVCSEEDMISYRYNYNSFLFSGQ